MVEGRRVGFTCGNSNMIFSFPLLLFLFFFPLFFPLGWLFYSLVVILYTHSSVVTNNERYFLKSYFSCEFFFFCFFGGFFGFGFWFLYGLVFGFWFSVEGRYLEKRTVGEYLLQGKIIYRVDWFWFDLHMIMIYELMI